MADRHENIDKATLEEVERLLTSTNFVTADDIVASGGVEMPAPASSKQRVVEDIVESDESSPLPKRR